MMAVTSVGRKWRVEGGEEGKELLRKGKGEEREDTGRRNGHYVTKKYGNGIKDDS